MISILLNWGVCEFFDPEYGAFWKKISELTLDQFCWLHYFIDHGWLTHPARFYCCSDYPLRLLVG